MLHIAKYYLLESRLLFRRTLHNLIFRLNQFPSQFQYDFNHLRDGSECPENC